MKYVKVYTQISLILLLSLFFGAASAAKLNHPTAFTNAKELLGKEFFIPSDIYNTNGIAKETIQFPKKWIIHPGLLAGDQWHIFGALTLAPHTHVIIVIPERMYRIYLRKVSTISMSNVDYTEFIKALKEVQKSNKWQAGDQGLRVDKYDDRWLKDSIRLFDGLNQLNIRNLNSRIHVISGLDDMNTNGKFSPYAGSVEAVKKNVLNLTLNIQPGDFLGMSQASTSAIAYGLEKNYELSKKLLKNMFLSDENSNAIRNSLRNHLKNNNISENQKILLVPMRNNNYKPEHNITTAILRNLVQIARAEGWMVMPIGGKKGSDFGDVDNLNLDSEVVIKSYNHWKVFESIDGNLFPTPTDAVLVADFWKNIADETKYNFKVFGARSGFLDLAAFMGVENIFCYDTWPDANQKIPNTGNIRLFLTWKLMKIGMLGADKLPDRQSLKDFLNQEKHNTDWFDYCLDNSFDEHVYYQKGFGTAFKYAGEESQLDYIVNNGDLDEQNKRNALLLYDEGGNNFPFPVDFFGCKNAKAREVDPGPDPLDIPIKLLYFEDHVTGVSWENFRYAIYGIHSGQLYESWWNGTKWSLKKYFGTPSNVKLTAISSVSWSWLNYGIYAIGENGNAYEKWWSSTDKWSEWSSFGKPNGVNLKAITAVSFGPDKYGVYAIGHNGALYEKWWNGSEWKGWTYQGKPANSKLKAISSVSWESNCVAIYVIDEFGKVFEHSWDGSKWSGWSGLGTPELGEVQAITAISPKKGYLVIYALEKYGNIVERSWYSSDFLSPGWTQTWDNTGLECDKIVKSISSVKCSPNEYAVIFRDGKGNVYQITKGKNDQFFGNLEKLY
ncbi:MAG: hypothetical protein AAFQ94_16435 [Bacteroidota bacterium]